jgi:hypothetical protein
VALERNSSPEKCLLDSQENSTCPLAIIKQEPSPIVADNSVCVKSEPLSYEPFCQALINECLDDTKPSLTEKFKGAFSAFATKRKDKAKSTAQSGKKVVTHRDPLMKPSEFHSIFSRVRFMWWLKLFNIFLISCFNFALEKALVIISLKNWPASL